MSVRAIKRLLRREDFRRNPVRALSRRVAWRLRWLSRDRLWRLRLPNGVRIFVPNVGSAALIYYQGCSEPETWRFIQRFLDRGMTFVDIGAHFGEYSMLAAMRVGPSGRVHAFEPQPEIFEILRKNVESNGLTNVDAQSLAVAESDGSTDFAVRSEAALSSMMTDLRDGEGHGLIRTITVPKCQLDTFCSTTGCSPHLIKVDVEGAELRVLRGAQVLLSKPPDEAPVWILEFSSENYRRFGHSYSEIAGLLLQYGYNLQSLDDGGDVVPVGIDETQVDRAWNLVASKRSLLGGGTA